MKIIVDVMPFPYEKTDKNFQLKLLIATMFQKTKELMENKDSKIDYDLQRKLLEKYQVVYKDIQFGSKQYDAESYQTIEELSSIASSTSISKHVQELFVEFKKFHTIEKCSIVFDVDIEFKEMKLKDFTSWLDRSIFRNVSFTKTENGFNF